jgi:hypothetical protein
MGLAGGHELLGDRLRLLEEVTVAAAESGERLRHGTLPLDAHGGRIHAIPPQHGQHALPGRRGLGEPDDSFAGEV